MSLTYASVCSGIEAPSAAWHSLGWRPLWFAEIEPFPSAVLAHHFPGVPNHGDFTRLLREPPAVPDVLVGGTPCQAFSVAGLRGGLTDPRGNLALAFVALVDVLRPQWVVWENVPGVLSSGGGRDFGAILGALGSLGYGWAYRVLDAQFFGLAQRRERVFLVGHSGADWRCPAAVLFEPEGVRWDSPPRREAGAGVAAGVAASSGERGPGQHEAVSGHIVGALGTVGPGGGHRLGADEAAGGQIVGTLNANGKAAGSMTGQDAENGHVIAFNHQTAGDMRLQPSPVTSAVSACHGTGIAVAVAVDLQNTSLGDGVAGTLDTSRPGRGGGQAVGFNIHSVGSNVKASHARETEVSRCLDRVGHAANQGGTVVAYQTHGSNVGEMGTLRSGNGHTTGGAPFVGDVSPAVLGHSPRIDLESEAFVFDDPRRFDARGVHGGGEHGDRHPPLNTVPGQTIALAVQESNQSGYRTNDVAGSARANSPGSQPGGTLALVPVSGLRRLTPTEWERLQGLPEGWTLVPYRGRLAADGPRYKAIGNSMAVPCVRWIGRRIGMVDALVRGAA